MRCRFMTNRYQYQRYPSFGMLFRLLFLLLFLLSSSLFPSNLLILRLPECQFLTCSILPIRLLCISLLFSKMSLPCDRALWQPDSPLQDMGEVGIRKTSESREATPHLTSPHLTSSISQVTADKTHKPTPHHQGESNSRIGTFIAAKPPAAADETHTN